MFHVDNNTGVPVMPPVAAELSKTTLYFTEGGNGIPPTYPGPDWFNIIQSELLEILRQANITPDKNTTDQIMTALKKLFITNSGSAGAIAGLTGESNTFPYFTDKDKMALTPLSAFVRGILGKASASEVINALSLSDTVNKANSAVPNTRRVNGMALSSDITISDISGNAGTATRLQTARRINNVLFDGSGDITISAGMSQTDGDNRYQQKNTVSKAANGWFKDTSTGMIIQWGYLSSASSGLTFPTAFPSACTSITITNAHGRANYSIALNTLSNTGATFYSENNGNMYWTAVGY